MSTQTISKRDQWIMAWSKPETRECSIGEGLTACMLVMLAPERGETIADFGCGTGRAARRLTMIGYPTVGIDFAPNCMDDDMRVEWRGLDERKYRVPLLVADITKLPHVKYADYGYCCDTLTHDMPYTAIEGIARTTRKGAFLAIDCTTSAMISVWQRAVSRFWKVSTFSELGNIALFACREPIERVAGADPWR